MDMKTIPDKFIEDTWAAMANNPHNTFLILTKRPRRMLESVSCLIEKFGILPNVWLGLTVVNQQEADKKIPIFLQVPGKKFLSIEPMLSEINFIKRGPGGMFYKPSIDAVILGGETGPGARPLHPDWVRSARNQCEAAGVPFFFKQWGEYVPCGMVEDETKYNNKIIDGTIMCRVGRKKSGRELDGRTHDDLPWVQA